MTTLHLKKPILSKEEKRRLIDYLIKSVRKDEQNRNKQTSKRSKS